MPKVKEIVVIPAIKIEHVAIYCRVSTEQEKQDSSLEYQAEFFSRMVKRHPLWELADIYIDRKPGTFVKNRPEFQRMISDSFAGKIDLIQTKSVSRFGRNTAETLDLLKRLRAANIDVFFEQEDMHSINTHDEIIISILSGVAQEESRSRSENIKWGIQRSLERSDSKLYTRPCFGYRKDETGSLSVFEPEAEIVRKMYQLYLSGHSIVSIIRELAKKEYKSPTGKNRWNKRTIDTILANEKYTGNVVDEEFRCRLPKQ